MPSYKPKKVGKCLCGKMGVVYKFGNWTCERCDDIEKRLGSRSARSRSGSHGSQIEPYELGSLDGIARNLALDEEK